MLPKILFNINKKSYPNIFNRGPVYAACGRDLPVHVQRWAAPGMAIRIPWPFPLQTVLYSYSVYGKYVETGDVLSGG